MSVIHETKIEHAHDAALDLTSEDLSEPVRSSLTGILSRAYSVGEDLPEDGSATEQIAETLVILSEAQLFLEAILHFNEVTPKIRTLKRKITVAEDAVINFAIETREGK